MAQQQSSRLNRLLTLLDTGSTQATRLAAARQIGDIAKSHPQDLTSLLKKVSQYLRSKNWDTRVASAHAVGAIAQNVKQTSLTDLFATVETKMSDAGISSVLEDVVAWPAFHSKVLSSASFRSFDLNKVLEFGALLASGGQEYDVAADSSKTPRDRLARQKQNLRRRLGLDVCEQFMDVNDMIKDEDLIVQKLYPHENAIDHRIYASASGHNIQRLVANMVPSAKRPSARQLNLLKRKAKINSKDQMKLWVEDGETEISYARNITTPKGVGPDSPNLVKGDFSYDDDNSDSDGDGLWPFRSFVEQLMLDMFDPVWEVRHGSIMALREILTHHGASAGVFMPDMSSVVQHVEIKDKASVFSTEEDSSATVEREVSTFSTEKDLTARVKREREIDLNMNVTADESEPERKRPKLGCASSPSKDIISATKNENCNHDIKDEDGSCNLHVGQVHQKTNLFKLDGESFADSMSDSSKGVSLGFGAGVGAAVSDSCSSKKLSSGNINILENLPDGSELMMWVKLARHSWLRNCEFLQDCAIRFLCVLSLDRFGDYVSDQVIAPVRETCAQALGATFKYMHPLLVHEALNILLQMQHRSEWEIRHGSLLGIKYLVAVRQDMLQDLLGAIIPACKAGLEDPDDDVRAVAAEALIPAAAAIVDMNGQTLHEIIMLLWDILLDLDDLSPSTSSVMNLLAEIYSQEKMIPRMCGTGSSEEKQEFDLNDMVNIDNVRERTDLQENPYVLSNLAPRLWPFMRHSITSVRHSAIRTLERLLDAGLKRSIFESSGSSFWPSFILGDTIRIVFQNLLLESNEEILDSSQRVWRLLVQNQRNCFRLLRKMLSDTTIYKCPVEDLEAVAKPFMSSWIELVTTPYGVQLDTSKMFRPAAPPRKSQLKAAAKVRAVKTENDHLMNNSSSAGGRAAPHERNGDVSAHSLKIVFGADMEMSVTHTRVVTTSALGILASKLREESLQCMLDPLQSALTSSSGVQRQVASMILISWFKEIKDVGTKSTVPVVPNHIRKLLLDLLACVDPAFPSKDSRAPYSELSRTYSKMRNEAMQFLSAAESSGNFASVLSSIRINLDTLTADDAINFISKLPPLSNENSGEEAKERHVIDDLESAKQRLLTTSSYLKCVQSNLHVTVSSLAAAAIVWMSELPAKLNPVILPLMASIKREQEEILQQKAAEALAELIFHCMPRKPGPNDKLIKNICSLTCMDPKETPQAGVINSMEIIDDQDLLSFGCSTGKHKSKVQLLSGGEDRSRIEGFISRRGAELALRHLCDKFGASLFDMLPKLWDCLTEILMPARPADGEKVSQAIDEVRDPQLLINNIQVVRSISPMLHEKLKLRLLTLLPCIFKCIRHPHVAVRLSASRCISTMAKSLTADVMASVMENAIPMLGDMTCAFARQGTGMLISLLVQGLGVELVPYAPLLVVPLLRCMSDSDPSVRQSVTHSFAALVPLLPLAKGLPPPDGVTEELFGNKEDARFLEQLLDNSHIDDYKLCTEIKVTLRRYQQEGINWLGFLKRFKLHGILCDDMGLGKTLQASAIVASDIAEHRISKNSEDLPPSLIICPSTLVGHWAFEIEKYIDASLVSALQYVGSAQDRLALQEHFDKHNIIITSYDVVRKDIDCLGQYIWNYCVLDEGHIIKNVKSKITVAVKQLKANHRLILSGTPIQNNIMDLWSLFDFLMPGFLGTERKFQSTYGKPLLLARDPKCSAKDAEAGILAMEALHKQVMPFLLRRTKDEVLSDLPEKIIQDRYCDLSPVQLKLYEKFSGSHVKQEISNMVKLNESEGTREVANSASTKTSSHVFQALQYLLKLCSHPLLVTGERVPPALEGLLSELFPGRSNIVSELHNLIHSPKLVALQEILEECGIGLDSSYSEGSLNVGQHRVLIFAQHKAFLDIIERDLFQTHMKSVTYLRLDGSVEPEKRFDIVKAFNSDPTIDALLLTTHVGGLGLNLTSADTLIFMEHDWNPMRDHQAMDRAHRLGQRKVVNVHRLIMRGTLEEKVMSLQKFKLSIANTVINADNASLKSMNTDQLLDLFASAETSKKGALASRRSDGKFDGDPKLVGTGKGLKAILGGLDELWDQSQYAEEYNLSQFLAKLNG